VTAAHAPAASHAEVARFVRARSAAHVYDETGRELGTQPRGTAIYTLADPRDLRVPRYVGQTRAPRRRFLQHVGTARLWLPDDLPWWVATPRQRPLYEWIRALYRDGRRLPVLVVCAWHGTDATNAERELIQEYLRQRMPLLNVESATLQAQIRLL
jgi:hypothetical protein